MPQLLYAVIALKDIDPGKPGNEVDQVVAKLKALEQQPVAAWLDQKRKLFYGKRNEDWKPFNGTTIETLINETAGYSTQTNLVDKFNIQAKNYSVVDPVRVYFIDAFALFLDKYDKLAGKIDSRLAKENQCCLVMSYDFPKEVQDDLLGQYSDVMSQVYEKYRGGFLHRIAMREDDLRNFRNYLINAIGEKDLPSASKEAQIKERLPFQTETVPGRE